MRRLRADCEMKTVATRRADHSRAFRQFARVVVGKVYVNWVNAETPSKLSDFLCNLRVNITPRPRIS